MGEDTYSRYISFAARCRLDLVGNASGLDGGIITNGQRL